MQGIITILHTHICACTHARTLTQPLTLTPLFLSLSIFYEYITNKSYPKETYRMMPTCPCSVMILWKLSASHCLSVPSWPHEKNICVFDMNWRSVTPPWWAFFSSLWKLSTVLLSTRNDISKYALVKENYMFLIINSSKDYEENQKNKFWWFLYIYIRIYKHIE